MTSDIGHAIDMAQVLLMAPAMKYCERTGDFLLKVSVVDKKILEM